MDPSEVLSELISLKNQKNIDGMARFGISVDGALGIPIPELRRMAKSLGKNHSLAIELWDSGIHEARILASMVDEPSKVTESQMESWVADFDSWDICDQVCANLFSHTPFAWSKAEEWTKREAEFVKRTGFALMAVLAVHDKEAKDKDFMKLLLILKKGATDERNFVRKAVNWALRQIGKRSIALNRAALTTAWEIKDVDSKAARWIAADAIRELDSVAVKRRLSKR
jgi:3-methyladenine DNA glycosylase AlkD